MAGEIQFRYEFLPEAMLPAWFVTDEKLVIRNWNDSGFDLLLSVGKEDMLSRHALSIRIATDTGHESIWNWVLDQSDQKNFECISEANRVLEKHIDILHAFSQDDKPRTVQHLVEQLVKVESLQQGVIPYVYPPKTGRRKFRLGVKVSPVEGLKLMGTAKQEGGAEYIDLVMACRLNTEWEGDLLRRVDFLGVQPALHDATERHRQWERAKSEEQAQITQFLSHALKTPIANIKSMVGELQGGSLSSYYQQVSERLRANVDDLSDLSDLILFINTTESIPTTLCASPPAGDIIWVYVNFTEVRDEIAKTLQSICNGRTRDPQDIKRVQIMAGKRLQPGAKLNDQDCWHLADTMLDFSEMRGITTLGVLLPPGEEGRELGEEVAQKVKTTFLGLVLVELLLNAVKYSDPQAPQVKICCRLNSSKDRFEISVINNGVALTEHQFNNVLTELASKPGEKRRALGLLLNLRAVERLGWELRRRTPVQPGTHLVLSIPFKQ